MAADTRLHGSKRSTVINRRVAIFLRLTSDGVCDGAELGWSGEHPVIQHPLHVCHVHGHEELEDPWNPARPGLRPRFLDPVRLAEVPNGVQGGQEYPLFELLGRAPEHRPRSAGTSSDWEPSAFETRAESIGMCRKRSFTTDGQSRRPARAAVCRIPCLILCLADVERVWQRRAPNLPCGVHGRMASVIAALFSRSRPPPPARSQSHSVRDTPAELGDYCSSLHPRRFAGASDDHCRDPRHRRWTGVQPHR